MLYSEYVPTPQQLRFHKAPHKYKLIGGAMGGGKTTPLCAEVLRLCLEFPGNCVLLARHTLKECKLTTMKTFFELMPQKLLKNFNKTDGIAELTNGSEVLFIDLGDTEKLKSLNLGAFAIDEASETNDDIFKMLQTRLRKNLKGIKYFGLMASNPEPGWLKDRFIDKPRPEYLYVESLTKDNPYLPKDYLSDLERDLPPIWRAKYLEGSWEAFTGQIIEAGWVKPSEDLENTELPHKYMAIDPAISEKDEADETSIITMGLSWANIRHEVETVHGRWSFNKIVEQVVAAYDRHKPDLIGVEVVAFQKALADVLTDKGYPIICLKADRDKIRRAIAVSNDFEQGKVRINTYALQRQLIEFPKGTYDDLADSCFHCLDLIRDYGGVIKKPDEKYAHLDSRSKMFWMDHDRVLPEFEEKDRQREAMNTFLSGDG